MASQSVQFFGSENVLQAYTARGIDTWGLFDKKQFINAGESLEDLTAFLRMLEPGGSQAVYTLKVYRDIEDVDLLTDRTECNGSFNFKLFKSVETAGLPAAVGNVSRAYSIDPIVAKLQGIVNEEVSHAIDRRLNGADKEDSTEEGWNEIIMGYVREPAKLVTVINALGAMFKPGMTAVMPAALAGTDAPARRVGAVPAGQAARLPADLQEKQERLITVLDRLERADPDILQHLEKLADIAEQTPAKYKMALSFL